MYSAVVGHSADVKLAGTGENRGAGAQSVTTTTLEQIGNNTIPSAVLSLTSYATFFTTCSAELFQ